MTLGVGGKTAEQALEILENNTADVKPIALSEFRQRISRIQEQMQQCGASALYLHAGTNLYYFTGLSWHASERMVAAIVPAQGDICYVAPHFEVNTLQDYWQIEAEVRVWHEHESPYQLVQQILDEHSIRSDAVLLDESTPLFVVEGLRDACPGIEFSSAQTLTSGCRREKSSSEIELIGRAHQMTMSVIQGAASILRPGMSTEDVAAWIDEAHRKVGAAEGSSFCIVLFGVATSFPHGVKHPQRLQEQDWVLIDTGCLLHGYHSDITRSFAYGQPTEQQRHAWNTEKAAQLAAFASVQPGNACHLADDAARTALQAEGFGPDYQLPGLPHRTGHGCGLDIHEAPYLVRGYSTKLTPGVVASIEPMLVIPDQFGVRLEDHFYVTSDGPRWFTEPAHSVDDPFHHAS